MKLSQMERVLKMIRKDMKDCEITDIIVADSKVLIMFYDEKGVERMYAHEKAIK